MDKELNDLFESISQHKFKFSPKDFEGAVIGSLQNRAAIKSMQLFILKYFSEITGKPVSELEKEFVSILTSRLADEYALFFSKHPPE